MYRVLLIGPEKNGLTDAKQAVLLRLLNDSGFNALAAPLGGLADGVDSLCYAFDGRPPHLLVVDLTAPASIAAGTLPLRHIQRIQREAWGDTAEEPLPLIALLSREHLSQRDLPTFLDDFLLPPHAPDELITRLRHLLFRRQHSDDDDARLIRVSGIHLDLSASRVFAPNGTPIPLTPREFDLLRYLLIHRGRLFSRDHLLAVVWGMRYEGGPRTVDIHIRRLRAKLPAEAAARVENRRGVGYGFILPR